MNIPTVWMEPTVAVAVQVQAAFREALAPEVFEEIEAVECAYSLIDDTVEFLIKRKRDGMKVKMPLMRQWLVDAEIDSTIAALKKDPQMFASLILFLA